MTWPIAGYTPIAALGEGASGAVVRARHDATGQQVAIKYLAPQLADDPAFLADFRAEARMLTDVDDANLARLYEYVQSGGRAAIVLELVDGVPLRAIIRDHGAMAPEAALVVLKGSLLGLAAAHARGVVHRDYKPENVLVTRAGGTKLIDFGIASRDGRRAAVAGTPAYMAPEQWDGAPASPAADVYAATCVLVECLTGRPPYVGDSQETLRLQHRNAPPPTDEVPKPVHGLVRAGLAKDPRRRPASAHEFVQSLEAAATDGYGADWEERGRRELRRLALLLAALLPLGEAGVAGGAAAFALTLLGRRRVLGALAALGAAAVGISTVTATTSLARTSASAPTILHATHTVNVPAGTASGPATTPGRSGATSTAARTPGATTTAPGATTTAPRRHRRPGPGGSTPPLPPPTSTSRPAPHTTTPAPHSTTPPAPPPVPSSVSFQKFTLTKDAGDPAAGDVYLVVVADTAGPLTVYLEYGDGTTSTFALHGSTNYTLTPQHTFASCGGTWTVEAKSIPAAVNQGATVDAPC